MTLDTRTTCFLSEDQPADCPVVVRLHSHVAACAGQCSGCNQNARNNSDLNALQFGHLFARGDTREAAVRAMVVALKEVKIRGEIRTIVDYAVDMIQVLALGTMNKHGFSHRRLRRGHDPGLLPWPVRNLSKRNRYVFCDLRKENGAPSSPATRGQGPRHHHLLWDRYAAAICSIMSSCGSQAVCSLLI